MKTLPLVSLLAAIAACVNPTELGERPDEGTSLDGAIPDGGPDSAAAQDAFGVCAEDATRTVSCGLNERGEALERCTAGAWVSDGACDDPDECVDEERSDIACDLPNGEEGRAPLLCERGRWDEDGPCAVAPGYFEQVSAGNRHMIARTRDGAVVAWGYNSDRQLGDDTGTTRFAPTPSVFLADSVLVDAGRAHSCGILPDSTVRCVGNNEGGQLGDGGESVEDFRGYSLVPVDVRGMSNAVSLASGRNHTCALTGDRQVYCWGDTFWGQLGEDPASNEATKIAGLPDIREIDAGKDFTCARSDVGEVWCWGMNTRGQLGRGNEGYRFPVPERVQDLEGVIDVSTGDEHACAVREDGALFCWGNNNHGRLGDGTEGTDRLSPVRVLGVDDAVQVDSAFAHNCVVRRSGTVACWGWNTHGQSGVALVEGSFQPVYTQPMELAGLAGVQSVLVGHQFSCAHATDDRLWCWGNGSLGFLGNGTRDSGPEPTLVRAPQSLE